MGTLDRHDAHQQRFRVADDLVVDDIRVDVERLHIIQRGAAIPRCPRWRKLERLAGYLHLLPHQSKLDEVFVEGEEGEGPLLPFETNSSSQVVIGIRHILDSTLSHDNPTHLLQENFHRFIVEGGNIDHLAVPPQLLFCFQELNSRLGEHVEG